jgi:hypothetical protein
MSDSDKPIVKTTEEARQARKVYGMPYVLGVSLFGSIIILGAITLYFQFFR